MKKEVICEHCSRAIECHGNLVTARLFIIIAPYHTACYAEGLKGPKTFFLANQPLNGFSGNLSAVMAFLTGLGLLFFASGPIMYLALLAIFPVGYRLLSYLLFERHLH